MEKRQQAKAGAKGDTEAPEHLFLAPCEQHVGTNCYHVFSTLLREAGGEPFCSALHRSLQDAKRIIKTGDMTGCFNQPFRMIAHLWCSDHRGCRTLHEACVFDAANGYFIHEFEDAPLEDTAYIVRFLCQKYPGVKIVDEEEWYRCLEQYDMQEILSHLDWEALISVQLVEELYDTGVIRGST